MNYIIGLVLMVAPYEKLLENYHIQRPETMSEVRLQIINEFWRLMKNSVSVNIFSLT